MNSHVSFFMIWWVELHLTNIAFIGSNARMYSVVLYQRVRLRKCWSTNVTIEWLLITVRCHVSFQISFKNYTLEKFYIYIYRFVSFSCLPLEWNFAGHCAHLNRLLLLWRRRCWRRLLLRLNDFPQSVHK